MHSGQVGKPKIILEDFASQDLWIGHATFYRPVAHSDVYLHHWSSFFAKLASRQTS
jgi:hypothetical protein